MPVALRRVVPYELVFLAVLTAAQAAVSTAVVAQAPAGWSLLWEDNFDSLDGSRWERVNSTQPTNNSLHAYLPQQVTTQNGSLVITATNTPYQGLPYRSGQVISRTEHLYGRFEVRADLPTSRGNWPAIWLLPDTDRTAWPSGGEIDIMENRGNQPNLTSSAFHYGTNPPYRHDFVYAEQSTSNLGQRDNYHTGFHTYAVDWTERYLRFYVDGVHHYTVHDADVGGFLSRSVAPMQLVINNAIGGDFLPNPDATSVWPQRMEIDWVRVYQAAPEPATHTFANGGFEEEGGTLAGWSVFGNGLLDNPNVSTSNTVTRDGVAALKVFGPFNGANGGFAGVSQGVTVEGGQTVEASLATFVRSDDRLAGGNSATLKIEFYDAFGAKYGTASQLGEESLRVADASTPRDVWREHSLQAVAPVGAVEARVAIVFQQPGQGAGAVYFDGIEVGVRPGVAQGDFNGDGAVDAADYTLWRDAAPGTYTPADLQNWRSHYGSGVSPTPSQGSSTSAPEPGSAAAAATLAVLGAMGCRGEACLHA